MYIIYYAYKCLLNLYIIIDNNSTYLKLKTMDSWYTFVLNIKVHKLYEVGNVLF